MLRVCMSILTGSVDQIINENKAKARSYEVKNLNFRLNRSAQQNRFKRFNFLKEVLRTFSKSEISPVIQPCYHLKISKNRGLAAY
jgi:hypothetical protein